MKKLYLGLSLIVMVIFIVVASIFWYFFFLDLGSDGTLVKKNNNITTLSLVDENKVYATYTEGTDVDENAQGYRFNVTNNGVSTAKYRLKMIDIAPSKINDGCTEAMLLDKSELNYTLSLNSEMISEGSLDMLDSNVLDIRDINIDITNKYELKIWLNDKAVDYEGKHFHYKIDLEVIE